MIETFTLHLADHILFLLLGILLPWRTVGAQKKLKDLSFTSRMRQSLYIGNSIGLWVMALIVLGLWWWLDRPFSSLGLQWTPSTGNLWSVGFVIAFLIIYVIDAVRDISTPKGRAQVEEKLSKELGILPRKFKSYLFFIPLAFSAGICEEIVFRGFFIGYFVSLFGTGIGSQILAVAIPAVIFGLVHTYQGIQAIYKIVGMAVIFGTIYVLTGSIYLLIILHVVVDLIGGAVGLFFPEPEQPDGPVEDWEYPNPTWEEE
ncbi:CPBP family intramembrane glutamic endopeptidase [Flavilitoribacter nigricans]|uniref:CAAX prenyl protease 2/Lysostaphin resistance protein A-like domain-containing protein n=1 Tax=Flavilitoribacter nigricans (strain ATCC 23147 / DSM 23189 / NBRC 102662 / NCIMB 1420 / SS-2) TaxID=1122177 RepID=A0A2D0NCW5_FLAN2|nr:CPBP family intramembrane glutamic endopeptidase [Flavilitoribacter nigricans]PHN06342.1 hypothetical protein CRP01_12285 [Flavilitoribacter nigricans DSM 23189 = NBRC 102662]